MLAFALTSSLLFVVAGAALVWCLRTNRALRAGRAEAGKMRLSAEEREEMATLRAVKAEWHVQDRRLQIQLAETQRELVALTYSVSHDLRAPLRGIDGFSQALVEDYGHCLDATAHEYLRRVRGNALQMSALIDDLLTLSRVNKAAFHTEPLDLSALALEIASGLSASEPARRVQWDIQPGIVASGDRELLRSAMWQLLGNAWKYTATRAEARVGFCVASPTAEHPAAVIFQVRDNGVGFDMQYAGKLFGAFQRMHPPEEFPGGRGIGLALAQRIVRRHGGDVWAEASPDQGAIFSFTLEAADFRGERSGTQDLLAARAVPAAATGGAANASQPRTTTV